MGNGISSCVATAMEIGAMQISPLKIRSMKIKAVRVDYISVLVKSLVARQPLCGVGLQHSGAGGGDSKTVPLTRTNSFWSISLF